MRQIVRTNYKNPQFVLLLKELDLYLANVNGELDEFYQGYHRFDLLNHVVLLEENNLPIACGAIKEIGKGRAEVKRMYTMPAYRGQGYGSQILMALESWASEMGFKKCVLETGSYMPDSLALYVKNGYHIIPNFDQYRGRPTSVCFEKKLPLFINL